MNIHSLGSYTIEIVDESVPVLENGSALDRARYRIVYGEEQNTPYQPSAMHGILVHMDGVIINSALCIGYESPTRIGKASSLVNDHQLLLCVCNHIYCLDVPTLQLRWKTKVDLGSCFGIYEHEGDCIVWGETVISRLDKGGHILWQFSGRDIFTGRFVIHQDSIEAEDFYHSVYHIRIADGSGTVI